jgi:hypothetical protein
LFESKLLISFPAETPVSPFIALRETLVSTHTRNRLINLSLSGTEHLAKQACASRHPNSCPTAFTIAKITNSNGVAKIRVIIQSRTFLCVYNCWSIIQVLGEQLPWKEAHTQPTHFVL